MRTHVLIVEDEADAGELLAAALRSEGYEATLAADLPAAIERLQNRGVDAVLTDLALPGPSGLDLCREVVDQFPDLPVILVTAHASVDVAVEALRAGAFDFLTKPVDLDQLRHRVRSAIEHRELLLEVNRLRRVAAAPDGYPRIIGHSGPVRQLFSMIARLSESDTSVLITGESGVGKELVARTLHEYGVRADGPFVAVNCAAVPPNLIESELFGHVRGAFTDAKHDHEGVFVRANGGTLFLDEIGELPQELQPKLLRALQERAVIPVGGDREVPFDVRIISATNCDLEEQVENRTFREDLFYRLNVVGLHVPPLRARGRDILLLAEHFLAKAAERRERPPKQIAPATAARLMAYDWPGNIRELENAMERATALSQTDVIGVADLPERVRLHRPDEVMVLVAEPTELPSLYELENQYIRRVLEVVRGNKTQAAKVLGVGRRTLYRRLEAIESPGAAEPGMGGQ